MVDLSGPPAARVDGGDTIFAVSSGAGVSGVAVIRLSGPGAGAALSALAGEGIEPRRATLRRFADPASGEVIDEGLALWFPGPRSFTGEDVAELHVHGSRAVIEALIQILGGMPGLRPAEAGEFALRAFRNGKLGLQESEGLADLLVARTNRQRRLALHQAGGGARVRVDAWRAALIGILSRLEAAVDFIDEPGVAAEAMAGVADRMHSLEAEFTSALADHARGDVIRNGFRVVLAGPPNAGKSSLFNALAGRDAAIVSARPGTTRDVIEAEIVLGGLPVVLCDTAGLRAESDDEIELMGMARTRDVARRADLVIAVSAPDLPFDSAGVPFDSDLIQVRNKADLELQDSRLNRNESDSAAFLAISAITGAGIPVLLRAIEARVIAAAGSGEDIAIVRERHRSSLERARNRLRAAHGVSRETPELIAEELRGAAFELARITGAINVEDLLGAIFSEFCVGK